MEHGPDLLIIKDGKVKMTLLDNNKTTCLINKFKMET